MNWENVDLNDGYERDQDFLSGYSFDILLLELKHNIRGINRESVRSYISLQLNMKMEEAMEIAEDNLENITNQALKERGD